MAKGTGAGASVKTESPTEAAVRVGVEKWLDENLRNTEFSRDTEAWNVLQKALPSLTPTIIGEMK